MTDFLSNRVIMPHQIWLVGNTLSDILIASAMIYHVCSFRLRHSADHLNLMVISRSHSYEQSGLKMATSVITP